MKQEEQIDYASVLFAFAVLVGVVLGGIVLVLHESRIDATCTFDNITWANNQSCSFLGDQGCPKPQYVSCQIEAPLTFFGGLID